MAKIGFYLGTSSDPVENVSPVLNYWGEALNDHDLQAFGGTSLPDHISNKYEYISFNYSPNNIVEKIYRGYQYTSEYIQNNDPDIIIQVWKYATHAPGVAFAGKRHGVPTVGRFTGDTFKEYRGSSVPMKFGLFGLNNINGRIPLYLIDKIITLGPYGKSEVINKGMESENVTIIPPPAPDDTRFSPPESIYEIRGGLKLPNVKEVLLYVGRMTEQKGMNFLKTVISELSPSKEYLFLLLGSGPYQSVFEQKFPDDTVRAIGRVPHQEIDLYFKAADCYLHPSPYEGLPLVILEALSCGTPVLARKAGDIEFVSKNITQTPSEMATMIENKEYDYGWKNRELFELPEQRKRLESIIKELAS